MTVKAGQKCTAIRRTIVPESVMRGCRCGRSTKRLDGVKIGDPGVEGVRMGPLAGRAQVSDVRRNARRAFGRVTELVYGDPEDFDVVGADTGKGAFFPIAPALCRRSVRATASRTTSRRSGRSTP